MTEKCTQCMTEKRTYEVLPTLVVLRTRPLGVHSQRGSGRLHAPRSADPPNRCFAVSIRWHFRELQLAALRRVVRQIVDSASHGGTHVLHRGAFRIRWQ